MEALNSALSSAHIFDDDKQPPNDVFPVTSFSDAVNDVTLHFQIIRLPRQAEADKILMQKLISLGYTRPRTEASLSS